MTLETVLKERLDPETFGSGIDKFAELYRIPDGSRGALEVAADMLAREIRAF